MRIKFLHHKPAPSKSRDLQVASETRATNDCSEYERQLTSAASKDGIASMAAFDDQTIKALLPLDSRRDSVSTVELERASNAPKAIIILQDPRNGEMVEV